MSYPHHTGSRHNGTQHNATSPPTTGSATRTRALQDRGISETRGRMGLLGASIPPAPGNNDEGGGGLWSLAKMKIPIRDFRATLLSVEGLLPHLELGRVGGEGGDLIRRRLEAHVYGVALSVRHSFFAGILQQSGKVIGLSHDKLLLQVG